MLPCIKAFSPVIIISFDQINKKQIPINGRHYCYTLKYVVSDFSIKNFTIILLCYSNMSLAVFPASQCLPVTCLKTIVFKIYYNVNKQ